MCRLHRSRVAWRLPIIGTIALVVAARTLGSEYTFTNIADSTGPYRNFYDYAMSSNGRVVFHADLDAGGRGIFTGPNPLTDTVADTSGAYESFGPPVINASGAVVFRAQLRSGVQGIYNGPNPTTNVIADTNGAFGFFGPACSINDVGSVVFTGLVRSNQAQGVFRGPNPATDTIADTTGGYFAQFGSPKINAGGQVAFRAATTGGEGIFKGGNPATDTVATSAGGYDNFSDPTVNAAGRVIFNAHATSGGWWGIFDGPNPFNNYIYRSVGNSGYNLFFQQAISDNGKIVFSASSSLGRIFDGPVAANDRVVGATDPMFGSAVTNAALQRDCVDGSGRVLFYYELENGVSGLALATPVPEASSLAAIVVGSALLRRRR